MYEQYTDKQIVKMLGNKLKKLGYDTLANNPEHYPDACKLISTLYKSGYIRGQLGRSFIIGEKKAKAEPKSEHWVSAVNIELKKGDKVKMIDNHTFKYAPAYYPAIDTVGVVEGAGVVVALVQWPERKGYCEFTRLEVLLCE